MPTDLESLFELVEKSDNSFIGKATTRIVEIIHREDSTVKDLTGAIEMDPALSASVLRLANSAYFGLKRRVTTVSDAIIYIGYEAVKELALSQKVCGLFRRDETMAGYSPRELWIHSLGVALCAKEIYSEEFGWRGDDVYMAGILHDLGLIVENQFCREEFIAVLTQTATAGRIIHEAEQALFGFCHEDVGSGLARMWNFPPLLQIVLGAAERPALADEAYSFPAHTIYLANLACQARNLGYNELPGVDPDHYGEEMARLNIGKKSLDRIMDGVEIRIRQMSDQGWF
jgi:HD-like signal output (HDOD) protein